MTLLRDVADRLSRLLEIPAHTLIARNDVEHRRTRKQAGHGLDHGLLPVAVAGLVFFLHASVASAQRSGTATGTLTVGSAKFQLAHAAAFPDKANADPAKETYRILVTAQTLNAAERKLAATAGANDADRQELAMALAERKIHGVEAIVGADKRVTRVNVYSPDSAMGLMLLEATQFEATAVDPKRIAGKLSTQKPIQDARINKPVQYEATFDAQVQR